MRTSGSIRTEPDRTEIRTTIRVEYSLISHPMRCRIMVEISISAPIITHMVKVWTIMCSTISTVMVRHTKIKQTAIRVININPETPFPSGYIDWSIEILGTEEPAILCITQYPAKIVITDIQRFIIIIQCPFVTTCYVIHDITDRINKVVINLIRIIILLCTQTQFIRHLIGKKTCLLTYLAGAHSSHYGHIGSQTDRKEQKKYSFHNSISYHLLFR